MEDPAGDGQRAGDATATELVVSARLARLIGADEQDILWTGNTTHGMNICAQGIDWRAGDNVVIPANEFPSLSYTWYNLTQRGVELLALLLRRIEAHAQRMGRVGSGRAACLHELIAQIGHLGGLLQLGTGAQRGALGHRGEHERVEHGGEHGHQAQQQDDALAQAEGVDAPGLPFPAGLQPRRNEGLAGLHGWAPDAALGALTT